MESLTIKYQQKQAGEQEKLEWKLRGANEVGEIWRTPQGQVVVTEQLEQMVLSQAHGAGHNNRMEMIDNTAPDGSITRALEGLESLSKEWAENSGIDQYSIFTAIMVAVVVLGLCGCCCIPCIRGLAQRVIETVMTKVMAVRVEEIIPLREELDSSEDWEKESCAV